MEHSDPVELWPLIEDSVNRGFRGLKLEPIETVVGFTVFDEPAPADRPRFNTKTGRPYPTNRNTAKMLAIRKEALSSLPDNFTRVDGPIAIDIIAWFDPPKYLKNKPDSLPTTKSDWDNLAKIVCDALNGYIYHDDKQIVQGRLVKMYTHDGAPPRWDIIVNKVQLVKDDAVMEMP